MAKEMKPSGIEWIGDVPEDWGVTRIKFSVSLIGSGTTPDSSNNDYYDGDYNWIQSGDIYNINKVSITEKKITEYAVKSTPALKYYTKDFIVIAMYGASVGNVAISYIDAYVNQACCCMKANQNTDLCFMYYYFVICKDDLLNKAFGGGQPNISQIIIKNEYFLKVPLAEQKTIADFLDIQCVKVDSIIAELEQQIEILKQYKTSLITETVTKGLNRAAPMKDSGIDWIGEIPAHWETTRIKFSVSQIGSGTTPESGNNEYYGGTNNWIQSGDLYNADEITMTEKTITDYAVKSTPALKFYTRNFIVVALYGASVGNVAICKIDAYANQACCCLKPNGYTDLRFMYYFFVVCKEDLVNKAIGGGQPNISQIIIRDEYFLKLPLEEQKAIADFLDNKCKEISSLIEEKQQSIDTMKAYKKSLIYEYVTGKKRVREAENG